MTAMYTMQPILLIGPADWDPARLPREEYSRRLEQVWADWPDAGGAIVYGDPQDHAALAYLMSQAEPGVCCPMTMTYAALPALRQQPDVAEVWTPYILAALYDPASLPARQ